MGCAEVIIEVAVDVGASDCVGDDTGVDWTIGEGVGISVEVPVGTLRVVCEGESTGVTVVVEAEIVSS